MLSAHPNAQVIVRAMGMMKKILSEYLKSILENITTNELQVEAVRGAVKILKRGFENEVSHFGS